MRAEGREGVQRSDEQLDDAGNMKMRQHSTAWFGGRRVGCSLVREGCIAAIAGALLQLAQPGLAQDPFAAPGTEGAAVDPFGAPAPAGPAPAAAAPGTVPMDGIGEKLPLVIQQLRDSDPQTPQALLQAALATLQFDRPDESQRYLTKFEEAKFPADVLAAVPDQVGSPLLFTLAREPKIQPAGARVVELVYSAARAQAADVTRIDEEIKRLSLPDIGQRTAALNRLAPSGVQVVTPMLRALADPARESEHSYIRAALARLATDTEAPLQGAIEATDPKLQAQVIAVLGRIGSQGAVRHLVRPAIDPAATPELRQVASASLAKIVGSVPDRHDAIRYLHGELRSLLAGQWQPATNATGQVETWIWNDAARQLERRELSSDDAALEQAARVAADLAALEPDSPEAQRLAILTRLELAQVLVGLEHPVDAATVSAALAGVPESESAGLMNHVLAEAIKLGRVPAIVAAARALGDLGDPSVLSSSSAQESPLAETLRHPDRRARVTAALAIARLNPERAFAGSSRWLDMLNSAVQTTGTSRILVGDPRHDASQTIIGLLNSLGFDGDSANTGRRFAELATSGTDYELLLICDAIDRPPVKELVQWLRKDYRTAGVPIGVLARSEDEAALRLALADDPLTLVFPRIHSLEVAREDIDRLLAIAGRRHVSREERVAQAKLALAALGQLVSSPHAARMGDVLRSEEAIIAALDNPALSTAAAAALADLGTPRSQTALINFASQTARPLADRQAAAAAFSKAVAARGLNLTQAQILEQFDRYNVSATLDAETQAVLGNLLDTIEAPTAEESEAGQPAIEQPASSDE
jgi:uncharacterized protein with GYD domain